MGDTWILSHGCSSTVWISLILYTDTKTCPIFTSAPKADTILWQQHWPGSSCQLVTETPFSFQDMQWWPGLYVVLHMDFLVQQSIMTIKWLLSWICSHTSVIWIKMIYTVRILNVFPGFDENRRHWARCCSLWDLPMNTCNKVNDFKTRQVSIMLQ